MMTAKNIFDNNVKSINELGALYDYFCPQLPAIDLTELLRAQYVMIVSALDYYIHNRVREGLLNIFYDDSKDTPGINIPLRTMKILLHETNRDVQKRILDAEVKNILSKDTYQSSRNIEGALGLIEIKKIWSKIAKNANYSTDDITKRLNLIVMRRNKIAHESDINSITGDKELIDKKTVSETIDFIQMLIDEFEKLL
jgi:hypothetical protein